MEGGVPAGVSGGRGGGKEGAARKVSTISISPASFDTGTSFGGEASLNEGRGLKLLSRNPVDFDRPPISTN